LALGDAAAREHVDVGDLLGAQPLVDVVGDVGLQQVVRVLGQDAGHVDGDVAGADHGDAGALHVPGRGDVGVGVVPEDELGGTVAAGQVDAGHVQGTVPVAAGGENDAVVVTVQVLELEVHSVLDVAVEGDLGF